MRPSPKTPKEVFGKEDAASILVRRSDTKQVVIKRCYKLITPLYGGGVTPSTPDHNHPISGKAIRGHLRFWWRATLGGRFDADSRKMKEAEAKIWGTSSGMGKPSAVSVCVRSLEGKVQDKYPYKNTTNKHGSPVVRPDESVAPGYASFPLRHEVGGERHTVLDKVKFDLTLTFPCEVLDEVLASLWAWETFGGVGARTRRGFGAICLTRKKQYPVYQDEGEVEWEEVKPPSDVGAYLEQGLSTYVPIQGKWPKYVPHLCRKGQFFRYRTTKVFPLDGVQPNPAWTDIIQRLKAFCQWREQENPELPKGAKANPSSLSLWPEPDAIRNIQSGQFPKRAPKHPVKINPPIDKFPRSLLTGMPKIYKFKDASFSSTSGDPNKTSLELILPGARDNSQGSRLASPLILRPILCESGTVGLAILLDGSLPDVNDPESPKPILRGMSDEKESSSFMLKTQKVVLALASSEASQLKRDVVVSLKDGTQNKQSLIGPMRWKSTSDDIHQVFLDAFEFLEQP